MRGTVLLLDSQDSRRAEAEDFRANELMVHEAATPEEAFTELEGFAPDVVVFCPDRATAGAAVVSELRRRLDDAASIIVLSQDLGREFRDEVHAAGADLLLSRPVRTSDLVFEVRRALILRRSGRRLPWNWEVQRSWTWWSKARR